MKHFSEEINKAFNCIRYSMSVMTAIPVRCSKPDNVSDSLYCYPFIGMMLGSIAAFISFVAGWSGRFLLAGCVYTAVMAALTRGFHLDGLGDMADGFGGAYEKEKILKIMSDSRSGSFSVIAVCLCLMIKAVSASYLVCNDFFSIVWCVVLSRTAVVLQCAFSSYAKPSGLSLELVNGSGKRHALSAVCQTAFLGLLLCRLSVMSGRGYASVLMVCFSIPTCLASFLIVRCLSYRRIGGITGDILGSTCEICETASLAVCALTGF